MRERETARERHSEYSRFARRYCHGYMCERVRVLQRVCVLQRECVYAREMNCAILHPRNAEKSAHSEIYLHDDCIPYI